jgi:exopolysaccharide production protein ExoZ
MIRPIQYLRGIAAMMVVWHHSIDRASAFIHAPGFGIYGVDLFFVISGFIMLVTTWDKPVTPLQFIGHRIRRVVPLYWTATLLMVGLAIIAPAMSNNLRLDAVSLLKSLLFIPYNSLNFPGTMLPVLTPGWTLDYEMFFYALFAASLFAKRNWRLPLMIGSLAALVVGGHVLLPKSVPMLVYTNPRLLEFAAGMVFGRLWVMKKHVRKDGGQPLMLALGDASYSIYLTHLFTLGGLHAVWSRMVPTASMASSIALIAVSLTICAAVGWACYWLVEKPLTMWLQGSRSARSGSALSSATLQHLATIDNGRIFLGTRFDGYFARWGKAGGCRRD